MLMGCLPTDDLIVDSIKLSLLVRPLVLIHGGVPSTSDPNGFLEPACGFVGFLIDDFGLIPPNNMIRFGFDFRTHNLEFT